MHPAEVNRHLEALEPATLAIASNFARESWWWLSRDPAYSRADVLQAARIATWDLILKYDPTRGASMKTWVFSHLRRRLIDWRRTQVGRGPTAKRALSVRDAQVELDGLVGDSDDLRLAELVPDPKQLPVESAIMSRVDAAKYWDAVRRLPPRERIAFLAGKDRAAQVSLQDVASVLGVTESRVCQLRQEATRRVEAKLGAA